MTLPVDLSLRSTRAIVDLDALAGNIRAFRRLAPEPVRLMAVVKANGYGHGAAMIARAALTAGATHLAVATVDEGVQLRHRGLTEPIVVLGPIAESEIALGLRNRLALSVADSGMIDDISAEARHRSHHGLIHLHLKIDTGMRRFGCFPEEAPVLARRITTDPLLHLEGIFTHFGSADEVEERPTLEQATRFDACLTQIGQEIDLTSVLQHAANSAATLRSRRYDYDMVRLGIAMYGAAPSTDIPLTSGMRPVMSIVSSIARVIELSAGDRVSYGGTYMALANEHAALIPIGYADGYRRALSNRGWMGIAGAKAAVRGRISMDQTVVGLPIGSDASVGDDVVAVGSPASGAAGWEELASMAGTIAYEMLTGVSARVPRVYIEGGAVVAIERLNTSDVVTVPVEEGDRSGMTSEHDNVDGRPLDGRRLTS
ncbi:MAG: alanine racemase [Thermomicrobiales bacterium]